MTSQHDGHPVAYVIPAAQAEDHISHAKNGKYDWTTGSGDHHGENLDFVHRHSPQTAKYVLLGKPGANKRIDCHPWVPYMLAKPGRGRVIFVMEGALKTDSCISEGEATFGVPSVTMWDHREVAMAVRWTQEIGNPNKPFIVIPDADWFCNDQVDRQALLLRSCIRMAGAEAYIAAPPVWAMWQRECSCKPIGEIRFVSDPASRRGGICVRCGGYLKGKDDYRAAGGLLDDLVIHGRESPRARIHAHAEHLPVRADRRRRAARALEGLSLHANDPKRDVGENRVERLPPGALSLPLGTLARVMGEIRTRVVVETLADLSDALDIVDGSLDTTKTAWMRVDDRTGFIKCFPVIDWASRPTIVVKPQFQACEPSSRTVGEVSRCGAGFVEFIPDLPTWPGPKVQPRKGAMEGASHEHGIRAAAKPGSPTSP